MDPEIQKQVDNLKASLKALQKQLKGTGAASEFGDSIKALESRLKDFDPSNVSDSLKQVADDVSNLADKVKTSLTPFENFDKALKRTFKTLTGVTDASDTLVGSFFKMANEGKSNTEIFEQFKTTAGETFNSLNIGTSIVRKVTEASFLLSVQMEKQTAAFNAQTGAGGKYNAQLREGERVNREFGISLQDIASSRMALMDGLSGYGVMQEGEQKRLTELTAQYGKLGVSSSDAAGILETSTRVLGQSTAETEIAIEETRLLAQGIGISLPKAMSDLNAALPKLAAFGSGAAEIFIELEKQSQETGLAISELTGLADKFMTFDDAAKAAGNLNAVLGTQMFDTMGLLSAQLDGPDAFINKLRADLQASVGDYETLNVFQKEAIANAAGMGVEQLSAMMNSQDAIVENTELQTSFNDALASGRSLFEELAILGKQLMISLQGPMEKLGKVFSVVNSILGKIPDVIKSSVALVGGTMLAIGSAKRLLGFVPGSSPLRPIFAKIVGAFGMGGGMGGGGGNSMLRQSRKRKPRIARPGGSALGYKAGKFLKSGMGMGMLATGAGALIGAGAEEGSPQARLGGAVSGAGTGAMIGSMILPGVGTAIGAGLGGLMGMFNKGTDSTPKGPIIVGDDPGNPRAKPEMVVPPPGSAVINNSTLKAAVRQNTGGQSNGEVLAAIKALASRKIEVTSNVQPVMLEKTFNGQFNKKVGAPGTT